MESVGSLVRKYRSAKGWSLRQLAKELDVTAAYVADIEAERRLPSADLKGRLATVLEIPMDDLAVADSRLPPELKDWIEERPQLTALLKSLHASTEADGIIKRLSRFVSRRTPAAPAPKTFLVTWESELRAIAAESAAWSIETGGDLFGRWDDVPVLLLATKAGPAARRETTHFRLDVDYLRELSGTLATDWRLRYFGDWHSHHRLGLTSPSGGDRRRILSVAQRNQFPMMAEMIVTLEESPGQPIVRLHPWLYDSLSGNANPIGLGIKVLPGLSPVREALIARGALAEQDFSAWQKVRLDQIRIGANATAPAVEPVRDVDATTRELSISHFAQALQEASGRPVERHTTGFGSVLVASIDGSEHLAYAVSATWPLAILEVHRMDRSSGTTVPLRAPTDLTALDIPRAISIYRNAASDRKGGGNVA